MYKEKLLNTLKHVFGYDSFRDNQEEIIKSLLKKQDVFAVMPTGAGKSLCYQLPAVLLEGVCIVVSPLISLMKDQVDSVKHAGIKADYINSSQTYLENQAVIEKIKNEELNLLYVAPERFAIPGFINLLKETGINLFAIDEAHCISEWGHDFRPDYLSLTSILKQFTDVPVAAFTATATEHVQHDIIEKLKLNKPLVIRASFNRQNLYYSVIKKTNVKLQILNFIKKHPGEAGIIYRTSRKAVEKTTQFLLANGIKALPYHAGLSPEIRTKNQEAFNNDNIQVIVATIAFGMGIDKSNIRFVVHGDLPKNMEGYYQETGRAGRDGDRAHCLLIFGRGDFSKIQYFIDQIENPQEKENALRKLNAMASFASDVSCRRKGILNYFNEKYEKENCKACDICNEGVTSIDMTREGQILLSAIARTGQHFGSGHIVDIVTGANTKKIRAFKHDQVKTYGTGKGRNKEYWRTIIDQLIQQKYLTSSGDSYPVLLINDKGAKLLKGELSFYMLDRKEREELNQTIASYEYNEELFLKLKKLRKEFAEQENVPPFIIFSDKTLHDMCNILPVSNEQMLMVNGVGDRKLSLYGNSFIDIITDFVEENNIDKIFVPTSTRLKNIKSDKISETREETWNLIQKGLSYIQIAEKRELTTGTILSHMEKLKQEGRSFTYNNHINTEKFKQIADIFTNCDTTRLQPIVEKSRQQVSYDEARLVRIFL